MGKRILIVNVNWVGDVLFSTPFIHAVRESHPDAYIACLLHPRCREMLETNPQIDEMIIYDEEGVHRSLWGKLRLILELKAKRFDTAYLLHRSFTKALITYLAGVPERIGYPTKNRGGILTRLVEEPDGEPHKVEYFLNVARASGIKPSGGSCEFFIDDADRKFVRDLLSGEGVTGSDSVVVLCPGGNWDPKRWPKENFARAGDLIAERTGSKIIISGAKKDLPLAEAVKAMMRSPAVVTAGKTTLRQLGALLERANLVIANDSGPMHIAVAMKAKTIALFGPTDPRITGPYGRGNYRAISGRADSKECEVPCYDLSCRENRCMAAISVDEILSAAREMLQDQQNQRSGAL